MNKKFTKLIAALALLAFLIPMRGWGQTTYSQITELDLTTKTSGSNSYSSSTEYISDEHTWFIVYGANNNKGWAYFKMGGKSATLETYNPCYIYNSTAIDQQVDKVTVHLPAGSLSKNGMSVNSWGLYVYSNNTMTTQVDYVAGGTITNSEASFDFTPSTGVTWAANYYYKVSWDLANTTTTNGIICVDKITLYKESADPSISAENVSIAHDAQGGNITCTINNEPTPAGTLSAAIKTGTTPTIENFAFGTVNGTTVPFTCDANTETTARTATVTLTYTYGNEAVTKDVTVTQAGVPYTTIPALFAAATNTETGVWVTFNNWVVSGVSSNGKNVFVTDNNGNGFVIYYATNMSSTFAAGNTLSGTAVSCTLKKYNGFAELLNVTATDLTITSGGSVVVADVPMADLAGINTGALVSYENLTCSVETSKSTTATYYYLSDGETTIQVHNSLFAFEPLTEGKIYNITGVYQQYNSTKEILPRSADDIEELTITSITASDVNLAYNATTGEIPYTINYPEPNGELTAAKDDSDWISNVTVDGANNKVTFNVTQNMTDAVRSGVITLTYTYTAKETVTKEVTVTQGVRDYANLPVVFDGGKGDLPIGFTQTGLGSDYTASPFLKFDNQGDYLILKINEAATQLHFDIAGKSFSGGTFTVEWSADGTTYFNLATYTELGNTTTKSFDLTSLTTARYFKWTYTTKDGGNVALGHIRVSANSHDIFVNSTLEDLNIPSGNTYTVYSPAILTLTGTTINAAADLVIQDGGQLIHNDGEVEATLQKSIMGYDGSSKSASGWYTIASPVDNEPVSVLATGDYDLYLYNEPTHEWWNAKGTHGFTTLNRGQGYLYANSAEKTASFAGSMKATNAEITVPLSYAAEGSLKGFNLVGNPFTRNLAAGEVKINGTALTTYYMVENGSELETRTLSSNNNIKPGQGFIVQATAESQNIVFNSTAKGERNTKPAYVCIEAGDESFLDRAYVQIGEGNTLRKMRLNEEVPHVYVLHNQADYAAATIEAAEGEMPVCFTAARNGQYTLMVDAKTVETDYLHLIDNLTGADIDLLQTPEYSFSAKPTDNPSRFRLVFNPGPSTGDQTDDEPFAYYNGSEWVINASGEATVLVIDMLGRIVSSHQVNSTQSVSTAAMAPGVYVMRLVNGSNVKTQKIVVR